MENGGFRLLTPLCTGHEWNTCAADSGSTCSTSWGVHPVPVVKLRVEIVKPVCMAWVWCCSGWTALAGCLDNYKEGVLCMMARSVVVGLVCVNKGYSSHATL